MPDIELSKIQPNRLNPRLEFTKAGLDELADSIRRFGLLEPILVRPKDGLYEVVVGERRYRAAHQAGLKTVPVIVGKWSDEEVLELNFIENVHREDLSAVEKGRLCKDLMERFPDRYPNQVILAQKLGITRQLISEWIQTTIMPEEIQHRIAPQPQARTLRSPGKIDYGTALGVTRQVRDSSRAVEVVQELAERRVPKRQAREVIRRVVKEPARPIREVVREVVEEAPIVLPFSNKHARDIAERRKTQTARKTKDPRLQVGRIVRASVTYFADLEVTDLQRKKLSEFDERDANREGGYTLDEFKNVWRSLHGAWNPEESVYVIKFRLLRVTGEEEVD